MRRTWMIRGLVAFSTWLAGANGFSVEIDFAHDVQPILSKRCAKCHSGTQRKGGLSINTRQSLLSGGESGRVVVSGKSDSSALIARLTATDSAERMPPEGEPLTKEQVETLRRWIDAGLPWEDGFMFGKTFTRAPLAPRRPDVPAGAAERAGPNPIDRFLFAEDVRLKSDLKSDISDLKSQISDSNALASDRVFARRAFLDLIGILPTPSQQDEFLNSTAADKRDKLIDRLLADRRNYADHWLTFWNDLLRNAYQGTGFIDGGRRQITGWLYESLLTNKPYDLFVRELVEGAPGAEGFTFGIKWRGTVNESQRREIQAAQSISQVFLGTNLKCASCHDSFVNDWKLTDAYAVASIFADSPLELHRCDKPTGKPAAVGFLYPELGQIDATARSDRQRQLAALLTKPENGRFSRVIVNRLWAKLMGRGLIEPLDNLDAEPWHRDLLDWLASDFVEHGHDLQHTLRRIATSRAYQLPAIGLADDAGSEEPFEFRGPLVKRLSAEQFVDAVTSLTNTWRPISPALLRVDGRGQGGQVGAIAKPLATLALAKRAEHTDSDPMAISSNRDVQAAKLFAQAKWIWSNADAQQAPANKSVFFRKTIKLDRDTPFVWLTCTADNECVFFINGQKVAEANNWQQPAQVQVGGPLKVGENVLAARVVNKGDGPNPAGFIAELSAFDRQMRPLWTAATNESWLASEVESKDWEKPTFPPTDWSAAVELGDATMPPWKIAEVVEQSASLLSPVMLIALQDIRLRASLLPQDQLQSALGRPHREQVVSRRESLATMLEALELTNGSALDEQLQRGADHWLRESGSDPQRLLNALYLAALGRSPTSREQLLGANLLGSSPTKDSVADVLWSIVMSPEFQLVP